MSHLAPESQKPSPCPRCGVIDTPTLSTGAGPHAVKATCAHCGRFIRWVSLLAPAERHARRVKARLEAMQQLPPSPIQVAYLAALGDGGPPPLTMRDASARIEALQGTTKGSTPPGQRGGEL